MRDLRQYSRDREDHAGSSLYSTRKDLSGTQRNPPLPGAAGSPYPPTWITALSSPLLTTPEGAGYVLVTNRLLPHPLPSKARNPCSIYTRDSALLWPETP